MLNYDKDIDVFTRTIMTRGITTKDERPFCVIPAEAGIQKKKPWMPTFVGMTTTLSYKGAKTRRKWPFLCPHPALSLREKGRLARVLLWFPGVSG